MRVDEFGVGFPPKLYGVKRGETEYTINLFPVGGFVKIYGEDADAEVSTGDFARSFTGKSRWAQAAVLVAGVSMNILFAWFLFSGAFMIGVPSAINDSDVSATSKLVITSVVAGSPADRASLQGGATIQSIQSGDSVLEKLTPSSFSDFIAAHGGQEVTIAYSRGDEMLITTIVPETGVIADAPERAALGVALTLTDVVQRPFFTAIGDGFVHTFAGMRDITVGIFALLKDAVMFKADLTNVAGPIGIVSLVGDASAFGFTTLLMFTAFISLNLAVINLLPFPALDGGRLLFVIIEAVKGGAIPARYTQILNTVGFVMLIILMIAVTWNDIARLL